MAIGLTEDQAALADSVAGFVARYAPREQTRQEFESLGIKLFIDMMSYQYLEGTEIDYVEGLHGSGFKFGNPNVKSTCGCGSSFSA